MKDSERFERAWPDLVLRMGEDDDGRTLEGIIVPWNTPAYVRKPIEGWEVYRRGALTRSVTESKRVIPLLGLHSEFGPVGKLVSSHDDQTGQHAVFRLFDTAAAKDAAELVRQGVWTGLSIGAWSIPARTKVTKRADGETQVERTEVKLDHVGLVRTPAFDDAKVLALRHEDHPSPAGLAAVVAARQRRRAALLAR